MNELSVKLNFSTSDHPDHAIKLHNRNRDIGYYYDNLCLYCANNNIDPKQYENQFMAAAEVMSEYGTNDLSIDHYYFWID
jgi:hypothetical protein